MTISPYQQEMLELLAQHEEAISRLYGLYEQKFPNFKLFWRDLSEEETEHAKWIRSLLSKIQQGAISFEEGRFSKWAVKTSLANVQSYINKIGSQEISIKNALAKALDYERNMIENKFFEVFETDSAELKNVLLALKTATDKHIKSGCHYE